MNAYEVVVLGAGPAGAEAAITAHRLGLRTLVIDEAREAGGQIYRAPAQGVQSSREGDSLRTRLKASQVETAFEQRVWMLVSNGAGGDFEIGAVSAAGSTTLKSRALIIATGATERFYPRPGWTLPGTIGLGAATVMIKAYGVLPGKRVLVAGPGPLAPLVAHLILEHGGAVAAIVDPNPRSSWIRALPSMAARPAHLFEGLKWTAGFHARGIPNLHGWDLRRIQGRGRVESATVGPVDADWRPRDSRLEKRFEVDAVCMGYGLTPSTESYRLLGAAIEFVSEEGGWRPRLDESQRTTVERLYAAGDGASILGASAAPLTGRAAAWTAALDLGRVTSVEYGRAIAPMRRELDGLRRFGVAVARMMQPRASAMQSAGDDEIICRCEDVTAGELRQAIAMGAVDMNSIKAATRCGMGPCGGRVCSESAAGLMECAGLDRTKIGFWSARPPLKPVPLDALTGDYDYADIPIKAPAPL